MLPEGPTDSCFQPTAVDTCGPQSCKSIFGWHVSGQDAPTFGSTIYVILVPFSLPSRVPRSPTYRHDSGTPRQLQHCSINILPLAAINSSPNASRNWWSNQ